VATTDSLIRLEEALLAAVVGLGIGTSAVLIWHGREPLSAVAARHPVLLAYLVAHFLGVIPGQVDPLSLAGDAVRHLAARGARAVADAIDTT
jgi:hypothetical protein